MKVFGYVAILAALMAWGSVRAEEDAAPAGGRRGGCGMMGGGCGMRAGGAAMQDEGCGMKEGGCGMKGGCACGMMDADANKDGKISDEEMVAAKAKMAERRAEMIKKFDKDGDGKLNDEERGAMKKEMPACHAEAPKGEEPK